MQTVKGTSLQLTIDIVRKRHGDEAVARLREALPGDVCDALPDDLVILPAAKYEFRVWAELLLAAEELFGKPISIARESARTGYRGLLAGTYASWVRHGQPRESVARLTYLWEQVTTGLGTYEAIDEPGEPLIIRVRLTVDPRYREITEERCAGVVEAMAEAAGGRARVRREVHPDHTDLVIRVRRPSVPL